MCGVKAHVIYDAEAERPVYLAVTPTRVNDITAAKEMRIEPGATYVFDLGYYDYAWWARLHEAGCRIVTRLKTNTPLRVRETRPVAEGGPILSDRIGLLPERLAKSRRNPMHDAVREIKVKLTTGKVLRILSNDLDAPATEIAELYKRRWAIELFFRWIKQTLKIGHFFGTSENAVRDPDRGGADHVSPDQAVSCAAERGRKLHHLRASAGCQPHASYAARCVVANRPGCRSRTHPK